MVAENTETDEKVSEKFSTGILDTKLGSVCTNWPAAEGNHGKKTSTDDANADDETTFTCETIKTDNNPDIDGGWAWAVAIGMAVFYFTIGGFFRSFGVLFAAILDQYEKSASETSLIPSVRAACMIFLGPVSTILSQRTSERAMVMVGSIIITLGFMASYFATSLEFLIGSVGLVPGIGVGLLIGPSNIMIGKYFNKRRATAISLTSCAGCVGQIVVPILMVNLIEVYTVSGALLIYGAVIMHTLITGMVMRPLPTKKTKLEGGIKLEMKSRDVSSSNDKHMDSEPEKTALDGQSSVVLKHVRQLDSTNECTQDDLDQMEREPLNPEGSIQAVNITRMNICCITFRTFLHDLFYYELLFEPKYLIVLVASILSLTMLVCQQIYLFAMAESVGFTQQQSAMFLSIFGGADMVGRLAAGLLSDGKCMEPLHVMAMGCVLSGTAFCFVPLATSMYSMIPLVIVIGGFISVNIILVMPVMVASLGMELFPKAFSILLFFHGITAAVTPPLLGLIKDLLGNYGPMFPLTGCLQILAGVLLLLEPLVRKRCTRQQKGAEHSEDIAV